MSSRGRQQASSVKKQTSSKISKVAKKQEEPTSAKDQEKISTLLSGIVAQAQLSENAENVFNVNNPLFELMNGCSALASAFAVTGSLLHFPALAAESDSAAMDLGDDKTTEKKANTSVKGRTRATPSRPGSRLGTTHSNKGSAKGSSATPRAKATMSVKKPASSATKPRPLSTQSVKGPQRNATATPRTLSVKGRLAASTHCATSAGRGRSSSKPSTASSASAARSRSRTPTSARPKTTATTSAKKGSGTASRSQTPSRKAPKTPSSNRPSARENAHPYKRKAKSAAVGQVTLPAKYSSGEHRQQLDKILAFIQQNKGQRAGLSLSEVAVGVNTTAVRASEYLTLLTKVGEIERVKDGKAFAFTLNPHKYGQN